MDNNNRNMMELNTEENQKKRERKEKIDNLKRKWKEWKEQRKEDKEDRIRAKEEKARVKEEDKKAKGKKEEQEVKEEDKFPSLGEQTITNETISKSSTKNKKIELTPTEKKRQKLKRQKLIRNIMTIPEIIIVILLGIFLKNKYIAYSKNVNQVLTYTSGSNIFEIRRTNNQIKVIKSTQTSCATPPCETTKANEYEVKFSKNQMKVLRLYLDLEFFFKSSNKSITENDLNTEFGKKSVRSMIHNNASFLSLGAYKKYSVIDYEQMSSFSGKGYKFVKKNQGGTLYIAMGEKSSSGYGMVVNIAYKKGDDVYFYVEEQHPEQESTLTVITHPLIQVELEETPNNIYVYNINTGEEFPNLDKLTQERVATESMNSYVNLLK